MQKFLVTVTEKTTKYIIVEANSEEDAKEVVNGDDFMQYAEFVDTAKVDIDTSVAVATYSQSVPDLYPSFN